MTESDDLETDWSGIRLFLFINTILAWGINLVHNIVAAIGISFFAEGYPPIADATTVAFIALILFTAIMIGFNIWVVRLCRTLETPKPIMTFLWIFVLILPVNTLFFRIIAPFQTIVAVFMGLIAPPT